MKKLLQSIVKGIYIATNPDLWFTSQKEVDESSELISVLNKQVEKVSLMYHNAHNQAAFYREQLREKKAYIERLEHNLKQYQEHEVDDEGCPMPSTEAEREFEGILRRLKGVPEREKPRVSRIDITDAKIEINQIIEGGKE